MFWCFAPFRGLKVDRIQRPTYLDRQVGILGYNVSPKMCFGVFAPFRCLEVDRIIVIIIIIIIINIIIIIDRNFAW